MKLIYKAPVPEITPEQIHKGLQDGYGTKHPERTSGYTGFFAKMPNVYAYGKLEKMLEEDKKLEPLLVGYAKNFLCDEYGLATPDEEDMNVESRWIAGTYRWCVGRYTYKHKGDIVIRGYDGFALAYSSAENMPKDWGDDPVIRSGILEADEEYERRT